MVLERGNRTTASTQCEAGGSPCTPKPDEHAALIGVDLVARIRDIALVDTDVGLLTERGGSVLALTVYDETARPLAPKSSSTGDAPPMG